MECNQGWCTTGDQGGTLCLLNSSAHQNETTVVGGVQLLLNVETSVAGFVAAEIMQQGAPVAGMELDQADQIKGNSVAAVASWGGGTLASLSKLAGQQVQVRVAMTDAKLFSLRLACAAPIASARMGRDVNDGTHRDERESEQRQRWLQQEEQRILAELARVRSAQQREGQKQESARPVSRS